MLAADAVCHSMLNLRLRRRMELSRLIAAQRETDAIIYAATADSNVVAAAAERRGGAGAGAEEVAGGAAAARSVDNARAMLAKMDLGVSKLLASILRLDETLLVVHDL